MMNLYNFYLPTKLTAIRASMRPIEILKVYMDVQIKEISLVVNDALGMEYGITCFAS